MKASDSWTLKRLMAEVVGSGPRSAADMSYEQARQAFSQVLSLHCDPTVLGAFWIANRWKSNTPVELAGFIDEMRQGQWSCAPDETKVGLETSAKIVDCGASYNGKVDTALLGVAAGLISASAGVPVAVHASEKVPTKFGDSYTSVLSELGVPVDLSSEESAQMLEEVGFGFYYQPRFHPKLFGLLERRSKVGVRTFLNTVETLANPAEAPVHLGSCYHLTFAKRLIDAAAESRTLDFDRIVFFQGLEGYDDVRPGRCKVVEWHNGELSDFDLEPEGLGLDFDREELDVDDVASDSAELTEQILAGRRDGPFLEAALLDAGLRIYAGGGADELDEAIDLADEALRSGEPKERLEMLRSER